MESLDNKESIVSKFQSIRYDEDTNRLYFRLIDSHLSLWQECDFNEANYLTIKYIQGNDYVFIYNKNTKELLEHPHPYSLSDCILF